jgi:hypothetical protein
VEEGGWVCVATSVEELESLGAELALSAKGADQELSSLVGAACSRACTLESDLSTQATRQLLPFTMLALVSGPACRN